ncbi:MAG: hypothetical protein KA339_00100 [Candidatus Kapabacteria bacterium]|nr:hypothetical protein [Ignavibacteria bacterium]MBK6420201.1 hypothetical protein [Ignavibacteria bacterium]MBK7412850.1 hypothetical protein [Ignavibacteria bacterium]MBP6508928.1 hypothetical protein [Candidatus Kapabacteria bacterium]
MRWALYIIAVAMFAGGIAIAQQDASCADYVVRAIRAAAQTAVPNIGDVVTYVIETTGHQAGSQPVRDTVEITRTPKVLRIQSRQGLFVYTTETTVQVATTVKRMILSKPTKSLEKVAAKAQAEAFTLLLDLIAASAKSSCEREEGTGNLVVTTEVKQAKSAQPKHMPITSVGGSEAMGRSQPTSITTIVTSQGAFVSISCTYPKGAPVKTLTVSNVTTRKARQDELDDANEAMQKLITKKGKPAAAYKDYTVHDLRNLGRAVE